MTGQAEFNLDDLPRLEFSAPRNLGRDTSALNMRLTKRFVVPPAVEDADPRHDPTGRLALYLAYGYQATQERTRALEWVERAIRLAPADAEARLLHARLLAAEERPLAAEGELRKVVAGSVPDLEAAAGVAKSLDTKDAISILHGIRERDPLLTEARVALAETLYRDGSYQQAENEYRKIQRDRPTDPRILFGLGRALLGQKVYDQALAAFEAAARLGEVSGQLYADRGETLVWLGRYQEAVAAYRQALRSNVQEVTWRLNLAISLAQLGPGSVPEAEQRLREVLSLDPENTRAWEELLKLGKRF
jgi:tetratricopeptide (TPR) repeat protein